MKPISLIEIIPSPYVTEVRFNELLKFSLKLIFILDDTYCNDLTNF